LAFGFRPIVIAYLHLVLLGVITLFLLGYIFASPTYKIPKGTFYGIIIFVAGIILNEAVLMIQGVASFSYTPIPYINVALLLVALTLFLGSLLLAASRYNTTK
jgi:fucose 4-O-acetylase-like acetyltransferase